MKIKNAKDFWAGVLFIGFGLAFVLIARNYQMGSAVRMGPAYFPTILGGLLAVLGLVIFLRSFVSRMAGEHVTVHLPINIIDLAIGVGVFALMAWIAKEMNISNDYAMLGSALVLSVLAILFRPDAKALVLILAACLAFAYLLKPLGLILAGGALIFVGAYGGHEFKWKEVAILAVALLIFSVLVFVKGLTLPFPICPAQIEDFCRF